MTPFPWLTVITFLPLLGALAIAALRSDNRLVRPLSFAFSLLALLLTIVLPAKFDVANPDLQFIERHAWVPAIGAEYFVAIDGLGLVSLLLAGIVIPIGMAASGEIRTNTNLYFSLMLLLQTGLYGAFTALNFFHWFIFWELSLIPAYFLIKLWGGAGRSRAAAQFFIYTLVGSVTMLLSFLAIFLASGTLDFRELADKARTGELVSLFSVKLGWYGLSTKALAYIIFSGVFLGFAVKAPLIPFHTWLPDAYSEAPTGTTIALTGAMSKMGVYGFLRILIPLFPEQIRGILGPLLWVVIATIIFSALAAFAQRDLKRILAYSSINHIGYCILGAFAVLQLDGPNAPLAHERAAATNGVLLQMFNHGITASALFFFVAVIQRRSGGLSRLDDFGGLRKPAPLLAGLMGITLFASLGLPGLNGFVGEFLIFKGTFSLVNWAAAISAIGLLISAVFLLTVIQRVFNGPLPQKWNGFPDLNRRELLAIAPVVALMFVIGIYPQPVLYLISRTATELVSQLTY